MNRILWVGFLAVAGLRGADTVDLQRTLKGVEDHYNKIRTLQLKFTESYTSKGRTRSDPGVLYLRKPGKMRWEYASGQLASSFIPTIPRNTVPRR